MANPPSTSWNLVRVYGTWLTQGNQLRAGNYTVSVPVRITNRTDDSIIPAGVYATGALQTTTRSNPSLDVQVPATDDPDNDPQPTWQLQIQIAFLDGTPKELYSIPVPVAGGDIDLSTVALAAQIPAFSPAYRLGVPGGIAVLNQAGKVVDASGDPITGDGTAVRITDAGSHYTLSIN